VVRFDEPGIPPAIEAYAVATGIPYCRFAYFADLGYGVFSLVPWTVAVACLPMLLGAVALAGCLHIATMHLFSAIPDIGFDETAGMTMTEIALAPPLPRILVGACRPLVWGLSVGLDV